MRTLTVFLVACVATSAHATKIAVPDMKVSGAEESLGRILTEIMTTETSNITGISVVGSSDISAMLGFEQEKQLLGCADDVSCMAEIGGALGVDMLLVSDLGLVGGTHVVNLKLIDTAEVTVLNRVYETVSGKADALIEAVRKAIPKLLAPVTGAQADAKPPPTKPDAPPPPQPDTPIEQVTTEGGGPSTWPMWTLIGVGGAALLAGTGLQIAANNAYDEAWTGYEVGHVEIYTVDMEDHFDAASTLSTAALGLFLAGGAMVTGGIAWMLLTPDSETNVAVMPTLGLGTAGLSLTGVF